MKLPEIEALASKSGLPEDALGERVKAVRESLGLNHDGLSSLTKLVDIEGRGISRTTVRGYELGTYKPGAREIRILSLALKRTPSWLLLGEDDGQRSSNSSEYQPAPALKQAARWADLAFPLLALSQLGAQERLQLGALLETMVRLKIGELRFRSMKSFVEDFIDAIQDAVRDRAQNNDLNAETMKRVYFDIASEMKKKHGAEEANLLLAIIEPVIEFWRSSNK